MKKSTKARAAKSAPKKSVTKKEQAVRTSAVKKPVRPVVAYQGEDDTDEETTPLAIGANGKLSEAIVSDPEQDNGGGTPATAPEPPKEPTGREKFLSRLTKQNVYVDAKMISLAEATGYPVDKKHAQAIVSEGKIVSVISNIYGFLSNQSLFGEVDKKMQQAGMQYEIQSTNRENKHFAVDYILTDESFHINIKGGKEGDKILPMLRITNSYAGGPCTGRFGLYREVCSNGLHVSQMKTGFGVRHKSKITEVVMPAIGDLVKKFMDNEFYSLHKKFEVLAETTIPDITEFVKYTLGKIDLFKYEASEKNPDKPSANAKFVIDTIEREAKELGSQPNLWLGYNAFNAFIHKTKQSFHQQRVNDIKLFDAVLEMAN